eukprot:429601-Pleurochrysis_carterae.AAC.1
MEEPLPRSAKGNVMRGAVEKRFAARLNALFDTAAEVSPKRAISRAVGQHGSWFGCTDALAD